MFPTPLSRRAFLATGPALTVAGIAWAQDSVLVPSEPFLTKQTPVEDTIQIPAQYYQQFNADFSRTTPEEGFGGWNHTVLPFSRTHSALVLMHTWNMGRRELYPGWYSACPHNARAQEMARRVFPRLLTTVRQTGITVFHVAALPKLCQDRPAYKHAVELAGPDPTKPQSPATDPVYQALEQFRKENVFPGTINRNDTDRALENIQFTPEAMPLDTEGIVENGRQLAALCNEKSINHLVYVGFDLNNTLLTAPGGMAEMAEHYGILCSVIRQAVTAVENKESAHSEMVKELALWTVAVQYGFVYDIDDFLEGIGHREKHE